MLMYLFIHFLVTNMQVLAVVQLPGGDDVDAYMNKTMIPFMNSEKMSGSLSCTLLAPASAATEIVESSLARLEYGCVALNIWSVVGYSAMTMGGTWGAHPYAVDGTKSGR